MPEIAETFSTISSAPPSGISTDAAKRRKVIVALDDSAESKHALAWALDNFLDVVKDHVILLTVGVFADRWGDFLRSAIGPSYSADRLEKMEKTAEEYAMKILEEATKVINEHSSKLNKSAQISHEIYALKTGDARDVIVDFCKDTNADVLVMGSRGLGALKRTMGVGSTSDYCVHNAPCPVIIVKQK